MSTTTVTATYLDPSGNPCKGRVVFRLVAATYQDGLDAIFPTVPVSDTLDTHGQISVELEPTSGVDADFDATDMTYQVWERINGTDRAPYYVDIPTSASVDLGTLATYDDPPLFVRELVTPDLASLGYLPTTTAATTYATKAEAGLNPGRRWVYIGDSFTAGSGASNAFYGYMTQSLSMAGSLYARPDSVAAGAAGYTSTQILAWAPTVFTAYPPEGVVIEVGANDSADTNAVSLATFQANIAALVTLAKQYGAPVVICTSPPRTVAGGGTAAQRARAAKYNMWLRLWAPFNGCELADLHTAVVDTTTGLMSATYDSGDGVHPNDAGHREIAQQVAAAILRTQPSTAAPRGLAYTVGEGNQVDNPLMVSAGTAPTGSYGITATGTAPTQSMVADTSGLLPAGQWAQIDLTAGAASVFTRGLPITESWSDGDTMLATATIQVTDSGGTWEANTAAATATVQVAVRNANTGLNIQALHGRTAGRLISAGVYHFGPMAMVFTMPAGVTAADMTYLTACPNGAHVIARFGAFGLFNLTTMGISDVGAATVVTVTP